MYADEHEDEGRCPGNWVWMCKCDGCGIMVSTKLITEAEDADMVVHALCRACLREWAADGRLSVGQ